MITSNFDVVPKMLFDFFFYPNRNLKELLSQARFLIIRLNEDIDINIPEVRMRSDKEHRTFQERLENIFISCLLINEKYWFLKSSNFEITNGFKQDLRSLNDHIFDLVIPKLNYDDDLQTTEIMLNFYKTKRWDLGKWE